MTRPMFLTLFALLALSALPAAAGTVTVTDGQGSWQSTRCKAPQTPSALPGDPETPANDLNAHMTVYDQSVEGLEAYMNCVSQEAEADARASGEIIIRSAQEIIQKTHEQIMAMQGQMQSKTE